jgi:hypothetical protein
MIAFKQSTSKIKYTKKKFFLRQEVYMRFILGPNKLFNLAALRTKYQVEKGVDLDAPQSLIRMPTLFGGTNVPARKEQIGLMEKMLIILKPNIFKEEDIKTNAELEANLTSARVILGTILFIRSQIGSSKRKSVLYRLLEDELGITDSNYLDEEDQEICILAAKRVITSEFFLEQANQALRDTEATPLSEKEWAEFKDFLVTNSAKRLITDPYANYPITNVTQKLFGAAGAYAGATVGMLSGEVISHSTKALSSKAQLTTLVGSTLLVFRSAGPAGVALFAPAIAERLISAFCSISLAHILGTSMGIVGKGVGIGVGMPLDITYKLLYATCSMVGTYVSSSSKPQISGLRIKDGMAVLRGIAIEVTSLDSVSAKYQQVTVDIKDGKLYIDDKLIEVPDTGIKLPKETIEFLKLKLGVGTTTQAEGESVKADVDVELDEIDEAQPLTLN